MSRGNTYRDGKVHVCARMCSTCIFRPGNLMHLEPGRVEQMVADATADDSGSITCHSTLHLKPAANAVCRGFYDRHATAMLQVAGRLNLIEWQQP